MNIFDIARRKIVPRETIPLTSIQISHGSSTGSGLSPKRIGAFTASKAHLLMRCERSAPRGWDDPHRITSFGISAEKYIAGIAWERYLNIQPNFGSTSATRWGTEQEKNNLAILECWAKDKGCVIEAGEFADYKGNAKAGATPDGFLTDDNSLRRIGVVEAKCIAGDYAGLTDRLAKGSDCKDYFQLQFQMLCTGLDFAIYSIALPVKDISQSEGVRRIVVRKIRRSDVICQAISARLEMADRAVVAWIEKMNSRGYHPGFDFLDITEYELPNFAELLMKSVLTYEFEPDNIPEVPAQERL